MESSMLWGVTDRMRAFEFSMACEIFDESMTHKQEGHEDGAHQVFGPGESDSLRSPVLEVGLVINIAGRRIEVAGSRHVE